MSIDVLIVEDETGTRLGATCATSPWMRLCVVGHFSQGCRCPLTRSRRVRPWSTLGPPDISGST